MRTFFERLEDFKSKKNYNYTTSEQSRILTYRTCLKLFFESPILGYGVGDANEELLIEYIRSDYQTNAQNNYNAHNQYFQTTLQVGIAGLLLLLLPLISIIRRHKNVYGVAMFFVLAGSLLFESILLRYNGIIFFAILTPLLIKRAPSVKKQSIYINRDNQY